MNGLTQSRALVNSVELHLSNPHRYTKISSSPAVVLLFRQISGNFPAKIHTFTHNHTSQQFAVPPKLQRRSTACFCHRYSTAMDSDPHPHSPEVQVTTKTSDDAASFSSLDDRSVVADEENFEANENEAGGEQQIVLPEELSRSVVKLSCESSAEGGNCDVYLVGTAHVSMESCQEVEAVISFLKPQVVFLELCSNRVAVLTPQNLKVPTMGEMVDLWKKNHNTFGILYSWFLAKVASRLEVFPGSEFRVAYEEAMKYGGKVVLGDRPVNITLRRTWSKMPLWHKTKLMYSLMFQSIFLPSPVRLNEMLKELDDVDMLTLVIQEMSKQFPTLMETLVHERDKYMSSSLLKVAREHGSVVAVVGKGHLQGIQKYWKQPVEVRELLELPSTKPAISVSKVLSTVGVAVAGVAIISGIYLSSRK
ncbi:putative TraB family protein [Helianthus annuus]|nr:putative TraB family protein [Helianthus annuus]KAJ0447883.1 putative TraB/PrgY/GumN family protein [Helianthus annuus]KAJ0632781.1 putative TraB/PrgY/GumN family protein [Helianthus annuus]KAJ0668046.1 putative TraB/PrgY/GumN family protein [Helianthus annuus]KAJ0826734.1 putative TraB family protein [Helianthus annuus]